MTKDMDDGYMGSGRRLANAKKKYGIENFKKEILSFHETPEEMLAEEKRLVTEEFLGRNDVYNLTVGGKGSWFWVNASGKALRTGASLSIETRQKISDKKKGTTLSQESRQKVSENNGMKNPDVAEKISKALSGKVKSIEHRQKIAESVKRKHAERLANAAVA